MNSLWGCVPWRVCVPDSLCYHSVLASPTRRPCVKGYSYSPLGFVLVRCGMLPGSHPRGVCKGCRVYPLKPWYLWVPCGPPNWRSSYVPPLGFMGFGVTFGGSGRGFGAPAVAFLSSLLVPRPISLCLRRHADLYLALLFCFLFLLLLPAATAVDSGRWRRLLMFS